MKARLLLFKRYTRVRHLGEKINIKAKHVYRYVLLSSQAQSLRYRI